MAFLSGLNLFLLLHESEAKENLCIDTNVSETPLAQEEPRKASLLNCQKEVEITSGSLTHDFSAIY